MNKTATIPINKIPASTIKDRFNLGMILRLILFVLLPNLVTTPLRIFVEAVIEGHKEAPNFVTVPFIIYGICAEFIVGFGYLMIGYKLPIKNTILRGFTYIMLILFSSYLPNILAMLGGDGKIIEESLTLGIIIVDIVSYTLKGLILGLLMKNFDVKNIDIKTTDVEPTDETQSISSTSFFVCSIINGFLFAGLNYITDIIAGAVNNSWRLCSILGVSSNREASFYRVFTICMFIAGALLPIWNRYCLPKDASISESIAFSLEVSLFVWLPNVLIMAFFGTPVLITMAYGVSYTFIIIICILVYRALNNHLLNLVVGMDLHN